MTMTMSRHNFTKTERDLLNLAVKLDILDGIDLGVLIAENGTNFAPINETIIGWAFSNHHFTDQHKNYVRALDASWRERVASGL